ncbi:MAG: hypothetical protein GY788_26640, partial [bacterium]|nr:hypothetical protein [bacterium]
MGVLPSSKHLPIKIHKITVGHPGRWLGAGWRDFKQAPAISLTYGGAFAIAGNVLAVLMMEAGMGSVILPLATGFLLVAPLLVVG